MKEGPPSSNWDVKEVEARLGLRLEAWGEAEDTWVFVRLVMSRNLRNRERGDGMVSYLIVLALVVLVCVSAAEALGGSIKGLFGKAQTKVEYMGQRMDGAGGTGAPSSGGGSFGGSLRR